jgi:hypothetical protein
MGAGPWSSDARSQQIGPGAGSGTHMSLTVRSARKHPVVVFGYTSLRRARVSERAGQMGSSGSGTENDGRQMLVTVLMIDDEPERCASFSAQLDVRGGGIGASRLEARPIPCRPSRSTTLRAATAWASALSCGIWQLPAETAQRILARASFTGTNPGSCQDCC